MERESFENDAVAAVLNSRFVCVKVDREERPDIDDLYMQATLAVRGQGGWPMTVFLEPGHLRPFWCGTYFPPEPRGGMPGLPQVADGVAKAWKEQRSGVIEQASQIAATVAEHLSTLPEPAMLGVSQVSDAIGLLIKMHDRQHGGFGAAPKFPQPVFLDLLLDAKPLAGSDETGDALDHVLRHTLDRMAVGGLFDQVGGGFHRYCVDAHWTVPHFEKMLYDQALLAIVYTKAAREFGDDFYERIARRTFEFVLRELRLPSGAFASALDAEVDGREGLNYLWTPAEVRETLGEADWLLKIYGLARGPNFRDPHHPHEPASNVLRLDDRPERLALDYSTMPEALQARLDDANAKLLAKRNSRKQPRRDDKALASWNGLMIRALAEAAAAFEKPEYAQAAAAAANAVLAARTLGGELARSSLGGSVSGDGFLEDYAFVAWGLLGLAKLGGEHASFTQDAVKLLDRAAELFFSRGRWFDTRDNQADLFVRGLSTHDGAVPSGVGVLLHAFLDAGEATGDGRHLERATTLVASISGAVAASPAGSVNSVRGVLRALTNEQLRGMMDLDAKRPAATPPKRMRGEEAVEIYAGVERIRVTADEPGELMVLLRIKDGYHVIAADPGPAWDMTLRPFRVGLHGGTGLAVYADYPTGKPIAAPTGEPVLAYEGTVEIRIAIEADGKPRTGRPLLTVSFQACGETECLAPTAVELDVAIDS